MFHIAKDPPHPALVVMVASFLNLGTANISDFLFQAAVPKVHWCRSLIDVAYRMCSDAASEAAGGLVNIAAGTGSIQGPKHCHADCAGVQSARGSSLTRRTSHAHTPLRRKSASGSSSSTRPTAPVSTTAAKSPFPCSVHALCCFADEDIGRECYVGRP